jgi:hypothetical protein
VEVEAFLTVLAVQGNVAWSTQNQALNAIVLLYRQVLKREFGWLEGVERAKKRARLSVVFTREEARAVLARLGRDPMGDGQPLVRLQIAAHGEHPAARQGRGQSSTTGSSSGTGREEGPHHSPPDRLGVTLALEHSREGGAD